MSAYKTLEERFGRLSALGHALSILHWDRSVMMPRGSNRGRGDALAELEVMAHELVTDGATGELLAAAEATPPEDPWQRANLAHMRRAHVRATALPSDLVAAFTKAVAACEMTWRAARPAADFKRLEAELAEVVRLAREAAVATGEKLGLDPYDALVDAYQPGLDRRQIEPLFATLARELPPRIEQILARQDEPIRPTGRFPADRQRELASSLMQRLGFDFERGRLDESAHPFCGGNPDDVRMTTRWDETDVATGLMAVLHETGHALYEAGLPEAWRHQPVGQSVGIAVHESQSLLIEMQASRSPAFLGHLAARLRETFGADPAFGDANLKALYHHVERGLIRVDADEVTYPLHVILRYRLEQALIAGDLQVPDLPGAWNEGMRDLVGVTPPDDGQGCLQDIHWPDGVFGYFPSYSIGALLAAQLYQAAERALPDLSAQLAAATFEPLVDWLRAKIHLRASVLNFDDLVIEATGRALSPEPFLDHLDRRYLAA